MTPITTTKELKIENTTVTSASQAITLIAYGDCNDNKLPFRCLDIKAECEGFNDLMACLKIIGAYNEFDYDRINRSAALYLNLKKYYNAGNPNNGNDFFKFEIAREGSPAFYVSFMPQWDKLIIAGAENIPYTPEDFERDMNLLKNEIGADEMDIETGYKITARFWFD